MDLLGPFTKTKLVKKRASDHGTLQKAHNSNRDGQKRRRKGRKSILGPLGHEV